jgi:hypothetical protein
MSLISEPGPTRIIATSAAPPALRHDFVKNSKDWNVYGLDMIHFHAKIEGCPKPKTFDWDKTI